MTWQWTPFTLFLSIATLIVFISGGVIWHRFHHKSSGRMGAGLVLAIGWWMLGTLLEFSSTTPASREFWDKAQFIAITALPAGWVTYTLRYVGREEKLTIRRAVFLWLIPSISLILVFTNQWHGLFWSQYSIVTVNGSLTKIYAYGPGFWLFMLHAYTAVLVGLIILLRAAADSGRMYRWQAVLLVIVSIIPWLVNTADVIFHVRPFGEMDITPFTLGITASVAAWTVYRLQVRDVGLIARHTVMEQMGDGVLTLDADHTILDVNPAAIHLLGQPKTRLIDRPLTLFWPDWPKALLKAEQNAGHLTDWVVNGGDALRTFEMRVTPLHDGRQRLVSRVIVLRDIGERIEIEEKLKASLQEKETLLKEIHHRVKNNLQIISSLLNLQAGQTDNELVTQALLEGQTRVRSMALIHENLYRSKDLARIDFGGYVRQLTAHLRQTYALYAGQVDVVVQADDLHLPMDTAVPCGLILNELVSNAFKHAFSDGRTGRINISFSNDGSGNYHLVVADNGTGLPPHFDYRQATSLGLQLVNTLVTQLEGSLLIESQSGTKITVIFSEKMTQDTS